MTSATETTAPVNSNRNLFSLRSLFSELMIINQAWAEVQRMRRLDDTAMRDLGLPHAAKADVSVSEVAARIRGRRSTLPARKV